MIFGEETPQDGQPLSLWQWILIAVLLPLCMGLGGLAVKLWPALAKSRAERAKAEQKAALEKSRQDAQLKRDAHEQVREDYSEFFSRQHAEMDALRRDRDASNERIRQIFEEIRVIDRAHADCLVKNERLAARIEMLAETIASIRTGQAGSGIPTRTEAVIVADQYGAIREWSPACTALFHWKSWEAVGRDVDIIIPPAWRERHWAGFKSVLAEGRDARRGPYFMEALTKDGVVIPIELTLSSWSEGEGDAKRRMFTASIRQRLVDSTGKTAEDATDMAALRAAPLPNSSTLSAIRRAAADPAAVAVTPDPAGGANVHVPSGATAEVVKDDVKVDVKP